MDNEKTTMKLDDTQRVRVLSPGMLVAKRFFRNKLAIVGLAIIICMFLFSFVGGLVMPYSESQVFYTTEEMKKDYAGATYIEDFQLFAADGVTLPSDTFSKMILAISKGEYVFQTRDGQNLGLGLVDDDTYMIYAIEQTTNPAAVQSEEYAAAVEAGVNQFTFDGTEYMFVGAGAKATLYQATDMALACKMSVTSYDAGTTFSYDFYKNVLLAMGSGEKSVEADGVTYTIEALGEDAAMIHTADGTNYAYVSNMNINSVTSGVFLTPDFKEALKLAIDESADSFEYTDESGETDTYLITQKSGQYTIQRYQETRVIDTYASPSKAHWCGTDANGMDLLARLMYGGRISLLIGFVVVFIELIIGVIVGGVAGFFGGWVDNVLMRVVDIVYCIPAMPLYLILGSIMDYYKASSTVRIYMLCIIMSIVGWVGIARIVRGQILSLREQEFMTAAEATGISIRRRIFKHLVPNVIPQLVVFASMGIGDVILAESTLSFLGLGIKYPAASWGSIINAVTDSYVMTNYLFVWVPAGTLILLTVLAFNFIGDGLRDAFDPKMKR
jgi:peptide/nickel transport system permease protein